jgi:glycosyltransferase involved in cell wall biosynthesis
MSLPFFSIIVPTRNRIPQLGACLHSIAGLAYPRSRFEVIIVDDGGNAPIEKAIDPFKGQLTIRLLVQPHSGPAKARNRGAAHARGSILAFIDDDCEVEEGWLAALVDAASSAPGRLLGGRTVNRLKFNPYAETSQALVDYLYDYYNADPDHPCFFTSNNLAIPAAEFAAFGGFDTSFVLAAAEDRDFCARWLERGYAMRYVPEAVVYHAHALNLRTFLRQHVNYGRGAWHLHVRRARRIQQPLRVEPIGFYKGLLHWPLKTASPRRAFSMVILLLLAQVTNAAGFCVERFKASS